jgi:hypothetical protein
MNLNRAMAELLGYETREGESFMRKCGEIYPLPEYNMDGNDMLELIEEMKKRGYVTYISTHMFPDEPAGKATCEFFKPQDWNEEGTQAVIADTIPEAVAKAAYRALTGKEYKEGA